MPLNIDWQQILLHMFNFVLLFFALYFLLYKPVKKFMDNRDAQYEEREAKTKSALEDADKLKKEYADKIGDAQTEAEKIIETSKADALKEAQTLIDAAQKKADEIVETSRARAQAEREEIIKSAKKEIAKTAEMMAEKIVSESAYDSFIKSAESDGSVND